MRCHPERWTIGECLVHRNVINESPDYQRMGGVWSLDKKRLLIDSLQRGWDIPKIYFHELPPSGRYEWAIIDGRQRLDAVWSFLDDEFTLDEGDHADIPFSDWSDDARTIFKGKTFDIVMVRDTQEEEIEELFSRLNNGEPLNSAEKRNGEGGAMNKLIAELAEHDLFASSVSFDDKRYAYRDAVAGFVLTESVALQGGSVPTDLSKRFLDQLVIDNKAMTEEKVEKLRQAVNSVLKDMSKVFVAKDPLLGKTSWLTHHYLTVREIYSSYTAEQLHVRLRNSLIDHDRKLADNRRLQPEDRNPGLVEFSKRVQNGTKTLGSIRYRKEALVVNFLESNPDVVLKDPTRLFTESERRALWDLAGHCCMQCGRHIETLDLVRGDHVVAHSRGGKTTLSNGQCLCVECNSQKGDS